MERVTTLRQEVKKSTDSQLCDRLEEAVAAFDKKLDVTLEQYEMDTVAKDGVPEWHKLMGTKPEYFEVDATVRVRILEEIELFIKEFAAENGLQKLISDFE